MHIVISTCESEAGVILPAICAGLVYGLGSRPDVIISPPNARDHWGRGGESCAPPMHASWRETVW